MHNGRSLVSALMTVISCGLLISAGSGCAILNGFLDPTAVGTFPSEYQERGIKRVLTPRDNPGGPPNAVEPTPDDLVPIYEDYRVTPSDSIQIVIDDLLGQGLQEGSVQQVSETGYVRLPYVGSFKIAGMTETEIEEEIRRRLIESGQLPDPVVRVMVTSRNSRVFYMLGAVGRAGAYPLQSPDTRLLEVIGLAQDIGADVKKLYVIRRAQPSYRDLPPAKEPPAELDEELVVPVPDDDEQWDVSPISGAMLASHAYAGNDDDAGTERESLEGIITPGNDEDAADAGPGFPQIIFDPTTGAPIEVAPETAESPAPPRESDAEPAAPPQPQPGFDWDDVPEFELQQRVIEIDVAALKAGDPRYNIVIRGEDVVNVPIDTGVFYMMGEIARPGVYAFGGREITLKQAIALVGGFTPLAWPQRCEIIRREPGTDTQITIPVDVDAVFAGLDDDVLLRAEDIVNVGTHFVSPFLFVIRNSFRFTYGFGFVYDRNFADVDSYGGKTNPAEIERQRKQQRGLLF